MIKIIIKKSNGNYLLEAKGHANSAPHGEDLICAAVSSILTGGINAIKNPSNFNLKLDEGYSLIESKSSISKDDEVVLQTIETQLKTIEESYPKFIKITIQ